MAYLDLREVGAGFVDSLPFAPSTGILGATFGAGAIAVGLSVQTSVATSLLVWSGSGQFAALPLWSASPLLLGLTALVLSLRFSLMTASMAPRVAGFPVWARALIGFCLTDENYALTVTRRAGRFVPGYLVGSWMVLYVTWAAGTLFGSLVGAQVPAAWTGPLNAVFPIVFLILIVLVCTTLPAAGVAVLGALLGVAGSFALPGGWNVVVAGVLASLVGPLLERFSRQETSSERI